LSCCARGSTPAITSLDANLRRLQRLVKLVVLAPPKVTPPRRYWVSFTMQPTEPLNHQGHEVSHRRSEVECIRKMPAPGWDRGSSTVREPSDTSVSSGSRSPHSSSKGEQEGDMAFDSRPRPGSERWRCTD